MWIHAMKASLKFTFSHRTSGPCRIEMQIRIRSGLGCGSLQSRPSSRRMQSTRQNVCFFCGSQVLKEKKQQKTTFLFLSSRCPYSRLSLFFTAVGLCVVSIFSHMLLATQQISYHFRHFIWLFCKKKKKRANFPFSCTQQS